MPRPPFTRFPKDTPLPVSQRGELTKAFNARQANGASSSGIREQTLIIQQSGGAGSTTVTTLAGDVIGNPGANTVAKIDGSPIAPQAILSGQTYVLVAGMLTPSYLAGDVAGSLVLNTVQAIQGVGVLSGQPSDRQELVYDASQAAYMPGANPGALLTLWTNCS